MNNQGKIRLDSKEEFYNWLKLYKDSEIRYHSFSEDEPWEYPCVMTYVLVKNANYDIEGIDCDDIYYCFIYKRNLIDHENV